MTSRSDCEPLPKPTLSPFALARPGTFLRVGFFTAAVWCVPALRVPLVHSLINHFRQKMHKRLAALPSRQAAEHRRGGGREMVSIPWVEGRTVAPPRASPPAARYARASCSRAPEVRKGGATCLSDSSANGRPTRDDSAACEILASTARAGQQRSYTKGRA